MVNIKLHEFIGIYRDEFVRRCRAKVAARSTLIPTGAELDHGVPVFLDQLVEELRRGTSKSQEINESAMHHGRDLFLHGFTVGQVVHVYGDVCQSVTDLAMELAAPIAVEDFRTLNRCLDDAIAGAVTEYARGTAVDRDGAADEVRNLADMAITAFDVLRTGEVAVGGSTGAIVRRCLMAIRQVTDRQHAEGIEVERRLEAVATSIVPVRTGH